MKLNLFIFFFSILLSSGFPSCENDNEDDEPNSGTTTDTDVNPAKAKPFAYFPFDGTFDDMSGNDLYGYGAPDPKFVSGMAPGTKAISFSKATESAFVVGDGLIDSRSMTICFWAKDISEGNIFHATSSIKDDGGEEMMTLTYRDGHFKYITSRYCNHYQFDKTGNFTHKSIEDGEWHHIALVSDYGKINYGQVTTSLYIDGRIMDTVTEGMGGNDANEHYDTGTKFILGGKGTPTMMISHLRVYRDCKLDDKRIKNIYNSKN